MPISRMRVQGHAAGAKLLALKNMSTAERHSEEVVSVPAVLQGPILQSMTVNLREVKKLT